MRAMTRSFVLAAAMVVLVVGVVGRTEAGSITYTMTVTGSGVLGASNFADALVTFTAIVDPDNVTFPPPGGGIGVGVPAVSGTVDVSGIGTATITSPVGVFLYPATIPGSLPQAGIASLPDGPNGEVDTIMVVQNSAFANYNLATSIGPVTGPGAADNTLPPVETSLGSFGFTSYQNTFTFQAIAVAVPEPSTLVGAGPGMLILAGYARRRRRRPRRRCRGRSL